jgi:hypothetical protein
MFRLSFRKPNNLNLDVRLCALAVIALCLAIAAPRQEARALDRVPRAPAEERFTSPSGDYVFVLYAPEDWRTADPEGELLRHNGKGSASLWRRTLPQEYRARFALVSDEGRVLMLDDWWNVNSGHAVVVLDPEGRTVAIHGYEAVRATLGQSKKELLARARYGWWLGGRPRLAPGEETALVAAGGRHLAIDLRDGSLSVRP